MMMMMMMMMTTMMMISCPVVRQARFSLAWLFFCIS